MMENQYTHSYFILNLQPGASWDELRGSYRSLIKTWHPDRFRSDGERLRAEEKTKEITRAYKTLADYYRKHGQTPTDSGFPPDNSARPAAQASTDDAAEEPEIVSSGTGMNTDRPDTSTTKHPVDFKTVAALLAAALLIYLWLLDTPTDNESKSGALSGNPVFGTNRTGSMGDSAPQTTGQFFTRGSKIGDVYSIHGIPTHTENGIWHYGKSKVFFANGSVTHWESNPENPLKASIDIESAISSIEFFTHGSTKSEVMALQGVPWIQSEREWKYGSSRIFFTDGLVTGWEESPLHPLKARK